MYKGALAMGKLRDSGNDLLSHSASSDDLAFSDFHLFPKFKTFVSGKCFTSNDEVERVINKYFHNLPDLHFLERILMLEKRWTKCNEVKGDYVEKKSFFNRKSQSFIVSPRAFHLTLVM
ncbi:histone-lysine N-methyltransferase SETMAR [Trichonephila inaurata madagascariensis]|uniref:Histone-lysine N-methyltransferase SETMAR n=1 Tax=Trichonephila inaurata madagascariensis TaxID=2747483 RepID=A0A8X6YG46_9ARAC|nr:histone-lysine N-methyltransferase SETMAR [Trichonephila inaurata madagascariensis]